MLTCKQVTELSSKKMDTSLPWYIRIQIKMHLFICETCAHYENHMRFIHKISKDIDTLYLGYTLSKETKQRIRKKLERHKLDS